jgi:hypothetical protein
VSDEADWTSDLAPAQRKRPAPAPAVPPPPASPPASIDELGQRFASLERAVRSIDVRLEAMERLNRSGLLMERIVDLERLLATALEQIGSDLRGGFQESASRAVVFAEAHDDELRTQRASLDGVLDVARALESQVTLVADRLSTLLGGPTLTELMDRIDDLERQVALLGEGLRSGRRPPLRGNAEGAPH